LQLKATSNFLFVIASLYNKLAHQSGRFLALVVAYSVTAIILVASLAYANKHLSPVNLSIFLSLIFLTSITSGLELGTAKHVLHVDRNLAFASDPSLSFLTYAAQIGVFSSFPIAFLWHLQGHIALNPATLLFAAVLVAIPGYLSTELKVFLDARGFHFRGILIKQAGLCLAYISYIFCFAHNNGIVFAVITACLARACLILIILLSAVPELSVKLLADSNRYFSKSSIMPVMKFMVASIFTCLSGSMDRLIALNVLDPLAASAYFSVFELLSKFWLFSYIISPIVYSKTATGSASSSRYLRDVTIFISASGLLYMLLASFIAFYLSFAYFLLPNAGVLAIALMSTAIVISSFTQIYLSHCQALGKHRIVLSTIAVSMVSSCLFFPLCYYLAGLNGFYAGWLIKSASEILSLRLFLILQYN
jgi:hypothetical protein